MTSFLIRLFIRRREDVQDACVRLSYGNLAGITGIVCNVLLCAITLTEAQINIIEKI